MSISSVLILAIVIFAALIFTLTNGLHDASSVVATFISCGAANPSQAIFLAAICGFVGALTSGSAVANTVSGIVIIPTETALLKVLLAAMIGAVVWNLITWKFGFPSSSTHALVGGLVGAVWIARGSNYILWGWSELIGPGHQLIGITKIVAALILSPVLGFMVAFMLQTISNIALRNAKFSINRWIKRMQWVIAGLLAYSHGANDTQKTVGIISLALASASYSSGQGGSIWTKGLAGAVMFAGTLLGGWPIMKTIGRGIYTIRPIHSLNSQLSSGGCIVLATVLGAPVSTTHVVVGSVAGVGGADEFRMVNWKIGKEIIIAWCITIPASAIVAALVYYISSLM
ncbi:inorganic phosphate transporter [Desulfosporosinus sp. Sb-LF]|uniref:inorganic phosphate transporter n=1 Tax=Desulfosporosinus sp. Sb-LF TaxID=2560027 RepID=UPI00107F0F81|nr:inorganic phosphate transporter [Desulfosporosinus sp. Sb-LF]TGE33517.1 inorganic phosphate transporter [Desulfosporosinus sp. Sb-LF]